MIDLSVVQEALTNVFRHARATRVISVSNRRSLGERSRETEAIMVAYATWAGLRPIIKPGWHARHARAVAGAGGR